MKLKRLGLVFMVLVLTITTTACSSTKPTNSSNGTNNPSAITSPQPSNENTPATPSPTVTPSTSVQPSSSSVENNKISAMVTDYLMNGQGDKPDADKLKWSQTFLKQVNIESVYKQYIANGGNADDVKSFAVYLTQNAPILSNWKELFQNDLYNKLGKTISRIEPLQGDLYQTYVTIDGAEVPYVAVSSRTGYFHG